jgi:hypothetical protein
MANPDHIAQLMKGVTAWNTWRQDNRDIRPDLWSCDPKSIEVAAMREVTALRTFQ